MPENTHKAWLSYRLRPARDGETVVGWYGGHPRGIPNEIWPRCRVCGNPMCHMAQIDAGPWADLGGFARMTLFICHATGGRCEDWDPFKGANRVLLQRVRDDNMYDGPPTVRVYRRTQLTTEAPLDEHALMKKVKQEGLPMKEALEHLKHDKLGGGAVWLQGDATPLSAGSQDRMRLVLQLTTDIVSFDITPGGMAYAFFDEHDPSDHAGHLLWQSGS